MYSRLKEIVEQEFDATISDIVNVCVEELIMSDNIKYVPKPQEEITIYRSVMLRKTNIDALNKINQETGISVTRLINIAIKEFLEKHYRS